MMNAHDWTISEARRQDIATAAKRHQMAEAINQKSSIRKQIGEWMMKTGQQMVDDEPMDVRRRVTNSH